MHIEAVLPPSLTLDRLKMLLSAKTSAHLYLFVAPTEQSSSTIAKAFLLDWLGASSTQTTHPDLFELFCSGKAGLHSVNRIRELLEDLSLTPHMSKGRAILIHAAERMLPSSSNTLLKALEEPPARTIILLSTHSLQKIIPTIVSRAQIIRLPTPSEKTELDFQPVLSSPSYRTIHAFTETLVSMLEEEKSLFEKEITSSRMSEDLPAASRHELEQDIESAITLWSQQRSKKILEEAYLFLRADAASSEDLTQSLLRSLKAIERGSELKRILPLFLAGALLPEASYTLSRF